VLVQSKVPAVSQPHLLAVAPAREGRSEATAGALSSVTDDPWKCRSGMCHDSSCYLAAGSTALRAIGRAVHSPLIHHLARHRHHESTRRIEAQRSVHRSEFKEARISRRWLAMWRPWQRTLGKAEEASA
jgi:hypothetical protein